MLQTYFRRVVGLVLLSAYAVSLQAQQSWAMAAMDEEGNLPQYIEVHCQAERGANGIDYYRMYYWTFAGIRSYRPAHLNMLQYGYRLAEKRIFIYDYETGEERLAFDFTLAAGDRFRTYNGLEWEVEATMDTLVNISFLGRGEPTMKRLLKVRSADGRYSDQWLEDFGSFTNHFMILPLPESGQTHTLWMEYDYGHYLLHEFSSDPIYTFDSGKPSEDKETEYDKTPFYVNFTYNNGALKVEYSGWHSPNRQYTCFYRVGDDFYGSCFWDLNRKTDLAYAVWHDYVAYFTGVPAAESGQYGWHPWGEVPAGITAPSAPASQYSAPPYWTLAPSKISNPQSSIIYDLQGRRLSAPPAKGLYIQDKRVKIRE